MPTAPTKHLVRRPGSTQTATKATAVGDVDLADGTHARYQVGDWLITAGKHTLAVVAAASFPGPYEVVQEGGLTLTRAERERLDATLGVGATRTGSGCAAAVERLASLHIGGIKLDFTPGQWAELQQRATKRGQTLTQTLQSVVDRIRDEIFHHS